MLHIATPPLISDPAPRTPSAGRTKRASGVAPVALGERSNAEQPAPQPQPSAQWLDQQASAPDPPAGQWESTLADCGFGLAPDEEQHTMARDIASFGRCCHKAFNHKPEAAAEFVEGFNEYVDDPARLLKCLRPWRSTREGGARSFYAQQDTLAKLLLGVDEIQTELLQTLVAKIAEHGSEDDGGAERAESIPRLCLNQIRWLDRVVDCGKLVGSLLEIMEMVSEELQSEIVEAFPEIIDDREHDTVVQSLMDKMDADSGLLAPILDALSNLNLEQEQMTTVHERVLPKLASAELEVLPLLVKFLLATAEDTPEGAEVIEAIRKLDVTALGSVAAADAEASMNGDAGSAETLVVESLRGGFRSNFKISHTVLKLLDKAKSHSPMDLWILLVLHSLPGHRAKVHATCRKKAKSSTLTPDIIERAVGASASALREYFSDATELAGMLTRAPEPAARRCGGVFYTSLFDTFATDYNRQEVLSAMITHTGSSAPKEVDCALGVARGLSEKEPQAEQLRRFLPFVQNIMDYMEAFSPEQIRDLYSIFANLSLSAMRAPGASLPEDDHIHILLRKQLSHAELKYKRMGILGATAMVACFGKLDEQSAAEATEVSPSVAQVSAERYKFVEETLELVLTHCTSNPHCMAFAYDELSLTFDTLGEKIDTRIVDFMYHKVSEDFEESYLADLEEEGVLNPAALPDISLKSDSWMSLDGKNAVIIINLLPMAASKLTTDQDTLLVCCSLFRLLVTTTRLTTGSVTEIDAVLGCPVYMFEVPADSDEVETEAPPGSLKITDASFRKFFEGLPRREQELATLCVFLATNWTRELLNGFCTEGDSEMAGKARQRLADLVSLESKLDICLELHPTAALPNLNRPLSESAAPEPSKKAAPKKKAKAKAKPKDDDSNRDSMESQQTQAAPKEDATRKLVHYNARAKPLMREMLLRASLMLEETEDVQVIHQDTETQEPVQQVISLIKEPRLMRYVLSELLEKVSFITRKENSSPFGGSRGANHFPGLSRIEQHDAIKTLEPALMSLRKHLVGLASATEGSGGIEDEPLPEATCQLMAESITLLVQVVYELLRCAELQSVPAGRALLCKLLRSLANYGVATTEQDLSDSAVFAQACYDAFTFLEKMAKENNMKNFSVASEFVPLLNQVALLAKAHVAGPAEASHLAGHLGAPGGRLADLAGLFLEMQWKDVKKLSKDKLADMVRICIAEADDPLQPMENKLEAVLAFQKHEKAAKLANTSCDGSSILPTLHSGTVSTYIKVRTANP